MELANLPGGINLNTIQTCIYINLMMFRVLRVSQKWRLESNYILLLQFLNENVLILSVYFLNFSIS